MQETETFRGDPHAFAEFFLDVGHQLAQQIDGLSEARSDLSPEAAERVWCGILSDDTVRAAIVEIVATCFSANETLLTVSLEIDTHPTTLAWWRRFRDEMLQQELLVSTELPSRPPNPASAGWDAAFDWFYRWQDETGQRMTIKDFARMIDYAYGYVRDRKGEYDAEHSTDRDRNT